MNHKHTFRPALWGSKGSAMKRPYGLKRIGILILALGSTPNMASAQDVMTSEDVRHVTEVRDVAPIRNGFIESNVPAGKPGMRGDMGRILSTQSGVRAQQRPTEATVNSVGNMGEFRSGAMPGYLDPRFGAPADIPIAGANPGGRHADGVHNTRFTLSRTFHIGEAEYQWFVGKAQKNRKNFDHGNGGYRLGISYRF